MNCVKSVLNLKLVTCETDAENFCKAVWKFVRELINKMNLLHEWWFLLFWILREKNIAFNKTVIMLGHFCFESLNDVYNVKFLCVSVVWIDIKSIVWLSVSFSNKAYTITICQTNYTQLYTLFITHTHTSSKDRQ